MKFGILTVSDSCFNKTRIDESGPNLVQILLAYNKFESKVDHYEVVQDDITSIKRVLLQWCDSNLDVILTTGGTGVSPRDVTPEATRTVIDKEIAGINIAMLMHSISIVPTAMLSRSVSGIRNKTLIINLPGSKKGSQECLDILLPVLGHAVDLIKDDANKIQHFHHGLTQNKCETDAKVGETEHFRKDNYPHSHHHHPGNNKNMCEADVTVGEAEHFKKDSYPHSHHHHHHDYHHHHGDNHHQYHHSREHHQQHQHQCSKDSKEISVCDRPRISTYPAISYDEALHLILQQSDSHTNTETVHYTKIVGRILAEDVFVEEDFPPFPASIKDGYAVIASDGAGVRKVLGAASAGPICGTEVTPGTCARINTGAGVPNGADAVVMVEDTRLVSARDGEESEVDILKAPQVGQDIRPIGSDLSKGDQLFSKGHRISSSDVGLFVSLGCLSAVCMGKPRIGVLSTGNELVEVGGKLSLGEIRDSNRPCLLSLLSQHHYAPLDLGIARDNVEDLLKHLREGLSKVDVLITTGGVSMGDKDYMKDVLIKELKAIIHFGRVNIKPGKPVTFATLTYNGVKKMIFALPGNPVSCMVTCQLFVFPSLRALQADPHPFNTDIHAHLEESVILGDRPEWQRGRLLPNGNVANTGKQDSCKLGSMIGAQVLIQLPQASPGQQRVEKGERVKCQLITPIL